MNAETNNPKTGPDQPANAQPDSSKNPFREEAPATALSLEEEAAAEQQRKEALTERD